MTADVEGTSGATIVADRGGCARGDLNPHALAGTGT
jgi:hypothetical protein